MVTLKITILPLDTWNFAINDPFFHSSFLRLWSPIPRANSLGFDQPTTGTWIQETALTQYLQKTEIKNKMKKEKY